MSFEHTVLSLQAINQQCQTHSEANPSIVGKSDGSHSHQLWSRILL